MLSYLFCRDINQFFLTELITFSTDLSGDTRPQECSKDIQASCYGVHTRCTCSFQQTLYTVVRHTS